MITEEDVYYILKGHRLENKLNLAMKLAESEGEYLDEIERSNHDYVGHRGVRLMEIEDWLMESEIIPVAKSCLVNNWHEFVKENDE